MDKLVKLLVRFSLALWLWDETLELEVDSLNPSACRIVWKVFHFSFTWAVHDLFFFSINLTVHKCSFKNWRSLQANPGPMVSEATALPTVPQPVPKIVNVLKM